MKRKHIILLNVLFVILSIGAILTDIYVKINVEVDFTIASTVCLTILTLIFTVWFSYLIAIKQLFQKKYEKVKFKKYITEGLLTVSLDFLLLFSCGVGVSLYLHTLFVTHIVYFLFCLIYFVCTSISLYKKIEKNEFGKLINENVQEIIQKISASEDNEHLKRSICDLNSIYNECFYKKDELACKDILSSYVKFLMEDLKTKNIKILKGQKEYVEENIELLLMGLCGLIKNEDSDFVKSINNQILFQLVNISEQFILCEDYDSVKIVTKRYVDIIKQLSGKENIYCENIYRCLTGILTSSLDSGKTEIIENTINIAEKIYFSLRFEENYTTPFYICKFLISSLLNCLENIKTDNKIEQYKIISTRLYKFVVNGNHDVEAETMYYMIEALMNEPSFSENDYATKDFYQFVKKLVFTKRLYANSEIVRITSNYIDYVEKNNVVDFDEIMQLKYDYASYALLFMKEVPSYVLPVFNETALKENLQALDEEKYSDQMLDLSRQCLTKNNINCLSIILSDLKNLLSQLESRDKDKQKVWMRIFFQLFYQASLNDNQRQVSIILRIFKNTIAEMDSKRKVSNDLGEWIINTLGSLCIDRYRENVDFVCQIVEYLQGLASTKESNFYFVNNNNNVDKIYKTVFDIGIDAVEKNQPLVIKRVSNVIGWALHKAISEGRQSLTQQLLKDAFTLYKLCLENQIDFQTIVFVGTLFVIIGAYCKLHRKLQLQRNIVAQLKKLNCLEYLDVSKQLRVANAGWNDILGNNPKQAMYDFFAELTK